MRLSPQNRQISSFWSGSPQHPHRELTRREFYRIAQECRRMADQYAHHDQHRVNLALCHDFNVWLADLQQFKQLGAGVGTLQRARPVARWQVMTLTLLVGLLGVLVLPRLAGRAISMVFFHSALLTMLMLVFVPEGLYGSTVEQLEGKVLRVVDTLEQILLAEQLGLTEAAFFQAKANLAEAKRELRQQIDLAHRRF